MDLWLYLIEIGKFDLIELLSKAESKQIHTIKIKNQLVPNYIYHKQIIDILKLNNVNVISYI